MKLGDRIDADIVLESKKRDHKVDITNIAISKVPLVEYREIPEEHYETLQMLAKAVLKLSRDRNNCNETAVTYSLDDPENMIDDSGSLAVSYGDEHDVDPLNSSMAFHMMKTAGGCVIIILHNHPSLSKISLADVGYLLGFAALKMVVVVTNLGSINYIVKQDSYDRTEALKLYKEAVDRHNKSDNLRERQNARDYFLNNCYKVGLIFEDH